MSGEVIIQTKDLTKVYGSITAVDHLSLNIKKGEIFGLLGPNGAGKTTTILMLLGLSEPTSGSITVAGLNPTRQPLEIKRIVGYMPDNMGFYEDMTGRENLYYTASLNDISPNKAKKIIDGLLEKVRLKDAADRRVGEYSRGMRQRLGIADVLLKDPEIIFLDEPTLGLDPEGTVELLDIIKNLGQREGKTILISSHLLHQVQAICDRVGIFVKGRLAAVGTISQLAEQIKSEQSIEIKVTGQVAKAVEIIKQMPGIISVKYQKDTITASVSESNIAPKIAKQLTANQIDIYHLKLCGSDLDDIYHRYFQEGEARTNEA